MTNSKWLSALLAGTALTVASTAAMADTSFLTMSRNAAAQGVTFQIAPTADMPAPAGSVTITGYVGAFLENSNTAGEKSTDINTESDISFSATTETAIGAVSVDATVNLEDGTWSSYTGALEFAPGFTFSGGFAGIYKADAYTAAGTTSMSGYGDDQPSVRHMALGYVTGPVSVGAMLYDASFVESVDAVDINGDGIFTDDGDVAPVVGDDANRLGVAGMIGFDVTSGVKLRVVGASAPDANIGASRDYLVGAQANFSMDMFSMGVAANTGKGLAASGRDAAIGVDDSWTSMTATAGISPVEGWTLAGSYGTEKNKDVADSKVSSYTISAKWAPVAQYEIVAAYNNKELADGTSDSIAGLGVWWKF